tara:strand:+ start:11703 stop:11954 length:252 start_codon:yes stop_codon:yes gene_type:complete
MTINPNEPAYPSQNLDRVGNPCENLNYGMPVRAEIASRIMAGLASNPEFGEGMPIEAARISAVWADTLLAELNKSDEPEAKNT